MCVFGFKWLFSFEGMRGLFFFGLKLGASSKMGVGVGLKTDGLFGGCFKGNSRENCFPSKNAHGQVDKVLYQGNFLSANVVEGTATVPTGGCPISFCWSSALLARATRPFLGVMEGGFGKFPGAFFPSFRAKHRSKQVFPPASWLICRRAFKPLAFLCRRVWVRYMLKGTRVRLGNQRLTMSKFLFRHNRLAVQNLLACLFEPPPRSVLRTLPPQPLP